MKLIVCLSNHYYDADEYSMCPYCAEMVAMNGGSMFYYDDDEDYDDYYEEDYYDDEETEEETQSDTIVLDTESSNNEMPVEGAVIENIAEAPVVEEAEPKTLEQETPVATPPQYTYPRTETYSYNTPVEKEKKGFFSSLFKGKKNTSRSSYPSYMENWRSHSSSIPHNGKSKPENSNIPDYLKNLNQRKEDRKKINSTNIPDFVKSKSIPIQEIPEVKNTINVDSQIENTNPKPVADVQEQKIENINPEPVADVQEQKIENINPEPVADVQEQKIENINSEPVANTQEETSLNPTNIDEILDVDEFINSIDISDEKIGEAKPTDNQTKQTGMSFSDSIADFLSKNLPDMENINTDLIGKVSADDEAEEKTDEQATPNEDMSFSEQIADFLKRNLPDMDGIDTDKIGKSTEGNEQAQKNPNYNETSDEPEEEINVVINSLKILNEQPLTVGWLVCINTDIKGESYTLINGENYLNSIIGGLLSKSIDTSIFYDEQTNSFYIENNGESHISINEAVLNGKDKLNTYDKITIEESPSKKLEILFVSLCGDKFSW